MAKKQLFLGLTGLLMVILAACGSSATAVPAVPAAVVAPAAPAAAAKPAAPAAAAAPAAPAAPAAVAKPAAPAAIAAPAVSPALAAYAAKVAGGPGAIYAGDLKQLAGPAPSKAEGDFDGNVPLDSLQRHLFLYDSDFYKGLLAKAKLTNPTPLVSTGQNITIQHACINRALLFCKLVESYLAPNLLERTKGQLKLTISSFPELGVAGPDTLRLVSDGTLAMGELIGPYLGGDLPAIEIQDLFGIFPDQETNYRVIYAVAPDMEKLLVEATGGGKVIHHGWVSGNNVYFFSKKALRTPDDWKGVKFRVPSTATSDWLGGMGASAQFMAFSEVYTAMERGILDGAMSGADAGYGQRWYEVTKYMNGPLLNRQRFAHVINKDVWSKLPSDLQAIMIEEGAKSELEGLRLASIQNEMSLVRLNKAGMEVVEFSPEVRSRSNAVVLERVVTNWVKRIGGPDKPFAKLFNEKVGPLVGVRIEPDGSVVKVPITLK
jgi:TRAP-type C4-dicarboxylate transport system substrate-binding protein